MLHVHRSAFFLTLRRASALAAPLAATLAACGTSTDATRVTLPVVVDAAGTAPATTASGWTVSLTHARLALDTVQFTINGEAHAARWPRLGDLFVGTVFAHPGHLAGGEVTGELPGAFVVDWVTEAGRRLGDATLLPGLYEGLNFTFAPPSATAAGGATPLDAGDPLAGHTAHFAGIATRAGRSVTFTAALDAEADTRAIGAPLRLEVAADTRATLGLQLTVVDAEEQDTLFDPLDFAALDADGDGAVAIVPGTEAHNRFRRVVFTHDHFRVVVTQETP